MLVCGECGAREVDDVRLQATSEWKYTEDRKWRYLSLASDASVTCVRCGHKGQANLKEANDDSKDVTF